MISLTLFGLNSPETFEEGLCYRLRTAFVKAGFVDARSINAKNFMELSSELEILQGRTSIVMLIACVQLLLRLALSMLAPLMPKTLWSFPQN